MPLLTVPEAGDDSGAAPVLLDALGPPEGDMEPLPEPEGVPVADEGPEALPVGMLEAPPDGRVDGPLGPEEAGGLPAE